MYSIILYVDALKTLPNIDDIRNLIIQDIIQKWHLLGQQLGILEAVLSEIKNGARRNRIPPYKKVVQMFELWLYKKEGTGDKDRSWSTILKALMEIGQYDVSVKVLEHFNPLETRNKIDQSEDVCMWIMCSVWYIYIADMCVHR